MSSNPTSPRDGPGPGPGELPPGVASALSDPDRPILLLVSASADDAAARTAISLADARAVDGRPTILVDGAVTSPTLHTRLGIENLEGLADVFLFGASLARVANRPAGHAFDFIPAGAYVPDPAGVMDSARWGRIATEVAATGSLLLLFVPAATPGVGALSRRIGRALVLADDQGAARVAARLDRDCEVLATVAPDVRRAASLDAVEFTDVTSLEPLEPLEPLGPPIDEPIVFRNEPSARAAPARLALLAALTVGLAVGGWFLYREYLAPAITTRPVADAIPSPETPVPAPRGDAVETPIPISVAVEAHQDLTSARQRIDALRRAEPNVDFYLAPVAVSGGLYYRLLAGPLADREAGTALLQRLVDAGHKTAFDTWAVRPTEYAFLLGEFDTRPEAAQRVEDLSGMEIPSYIVTVRYDPGRPRYRVYGGAFETAVEAEVMQELLENADLEATLVPRTGEPIA
jgi:hypothetical protein